MKRIAFIAIFILLSVFSQHQTAVAQCAMCTISAEQGVKNGNTQSKGLNTGVLYLMAIPYLLIGGLASTFAFLKDIARNNNREWFAEHKAAYEQAKEDVLAFVKKLIPEIAKTDPLLSADTDPKKCVLRIYRDVRFSKNKDPYKINFGIWFSSRTKVGPEPGYYLHLEPGNSFIAGGYWMPESAHLKLIRQEIDYNISDFLEIVKEKDFSEHFSFSMENSLKNAPKGYDPEDPNIAYLKLKSFEVIKNLKDEEFFKPEIVNKLKKYFETIYPLVAFLRNAIEQ
eukprot:gene3377-3837_t